MDIAGLLETAPGPDEEARRGVLDRAARVLRPREALARLDELAGWLAGWQRSARPAVEHPVLVVFCADHGVVAENVSPYPSSITAEVLRALRRGVATVNRMAAVADVEVRAVDVGVGRPTGNLAVQSALTEEAFQEAWATGREAAAGAGADVLLLGEVGIGSTTSAAAVCAALFGGPAAGWVGRGSGLDAEGIKRKAEVVERAIRRLESAPEPLEVLRQVGGSELVAMCSAVLEARLRSIPLILDGFVVTASAAPLARGGPSALDHCLAAHRSVEPGHRRLLDVLGLPPLLELDMALGEGSGAVAAVPLLRMACAAVNEVPTFSEWGLTGLA